MTLEVLTKGSRTQNLRTPLHIFNEIEERFGRKCGFTIDFAADAENTLCPWYFDEAHSALALDSDPSRRSSSIQLSRKSEHVTHRGWMEKFGGRLDNVFDNPPFADIERHVLRLELARSRKEIQMGALLVPARADKAWWHFAASRGQIYPFRGRIQYVNPDGSIMTQPFEASAVIVFEQPMVAWER